MPRLRVRRRVVAACTTKYCSVDRRRGLVRGHCISGARLLRWELVGQEDWMGQSDELIAMELAVAEVQVAMAEMVVEAMELIR